MVNFKQQLLKVKRFWSFAVSLRKTALKSDFYRCFHDFIHAGTGADNSNGVNFEHHRKLLSLIICCKCQDCFEL